MEKFSFLVLGAGAIGTYIGGSLALQGHHVTFVEQPRAVEALSLHGLHMDLSADKRRKSGPVVNVPPGRFGLSFEPSLEAALARREFDFGIYALKSFDTAAALEQMQPLAEKLPLFLCLSNGVENEPALSEVLGKDRVMAGTVTSAVGRKGIGDIVLERLRGVGVEDGHPLSLALQVSLEQAGLNARLYRRADSMKWSKMLSNLLLNASVAILDMPPAEVMADPRLFRLEMTMLREALAVMSRKGIRVVNTPKTPVKLLALGARLPAFLARPLMAKAAGGGRGGKMPSFHIDLQSQRGITEVQWLNGAVVRFGGQVKVNTPVNRALTRLLVALASGEIPLQEFAHQPEKLLEMVEKEKKLTSYE